MIVAIICTEHKEFKLNLPECKNLTEANNFINNKLKQERPVAFGGKNKVISIRPAARILSFEVFKEQPERPGSTLGVPEHLKGIDKGLEEETQQERKEQPQGPFTVKGGVDFLGTKRMLEVQGYNFRGQNFFLPLFIDDGEVLQSFGNKDNIGDVTDQLLKRKGYDDSKIVVPGSIIPNKEEAVEYLKDYAKDTLGPKKPGPGEKTAQAYPDWKEE